MEAVGALFGLDLTERNYSMFTVPAAFLCAYIPQAIAVYLAGKTYDNANPRDLRKNVTETKDLSEDTKNQILRASAASENGFETLGVYAAGVVAANYANIYTPVLNIFTFSYVLSRVVYNVAYMYQWENRLWATLRSGIWGVGVGFAWALWYYAGLAVMDKNGACDKRRL